MSISMAGTFGRIKGKIAFCLICEWNSAQISIIAALLPVEISVPECCGFEAKLTTESMVVQMQTSHQLRKSSKTRLRILKHCSCEACMVLHFHTCFMSKRSNLLVANRRTNSHHTKEYCVTSDSYIWLWRYIWVHTPPFSPTDPLPPSAQNRVSSNLLPPALIYWNSGENSKKIYGYQEWVGGKNELKSWGEGK